LQLSFGLPPLLFLHPLFVLGEEGVDLPFLAVDSVPDVFEGKRRVDDDIFDAGHVEASPFPEGVGHEGGDVPLPEDLDDLLGGVLLFLEFLLGNALLVYFLPQLAHRLLAFLDIAEEGGLDAGHSFKGSIKIINS
jgi:hypothetical protein